MRFTTWIGVGAGLIMAGAAFAEPPVLVLPYDGSGSQGEIALPGLTKTPPINPPDSGALPSVVRDYAIKLQQGRPGLSPDPQAALDYFEKAADKGDPFGRQKMCVAYLLGEGRPVNVAKSNGYCAKLDNDDAVKLFGGAYDYDHGLSGPRDETAALTLYQEAAKRGSGDAMDAIGMKVLTGHPGKADVARTWFRHAAMENSADGIDHLAGMVAAGQGGPADADEAWWLYVNAARRGNAHAKAWLAQQPAREPLRRVSLFAGLSHAPQPLLSVPDGASAMKPFTLPDLEKDIENLYPKYAAQDEQEGRAVVHCYIGGDQHIDVCLVQEEQPLGYSFAATIQALFNSKVVVAAKDGHGQLTAHTVFSLAANWEISHAGN